MLGRHRVAVDVLDAAPILHDGDTPATQERAGVEESGVDPVTALGCRLGRVELAKHPRHRLHHGEPQVNAPGPVEAHADEGDGQLAAVAVSHLIRALVESAGLPLAAVRKVTAALDEPPETWHELLGRA
jgi:hypothetical protein